MNFSLNLCRLPRGRPAGLPLCPEFHGGAVVRERAISVPFVAAAAVDHVLIALWPMSMPTQRDENGHSASPFWRPPVSPAGVRGETMIPLIANG